ALFFRACCRTSRKTCMESSLSLGFRSSSRDAALYFAFRRWNNSQELRSTQLCSSFPSSRTAQTAVPVKSIGRRSAGKPNIPLFLPVTRQRDAAAGFVLKCLDDLELEIGDLFQKLLHPFFELFFRNDIDAAAGDDKIVDYEFVDRLGMARRPDRRPEIFDDLDRVNFFHRFPCRGGLYP